MKQPFALALPLLVLLACSGAPAPDETGSGPAVPRAGAVSADGARIVVLDPAARDAAGITTTAVARVRRSDGLDAPAVIALDETRTARIGAIAEGVVARTLVEVGDRVGGRATLAELHSHAVHDAWADYRKAEAEQRRATSELDFAREAEARARRLHADQAIALQDVQRAAVERVAATERLDVARIEVRRARQALDHLGIPPDAPGDDVDLVPVRTPLAGVVLERLVSTGTAVTPGTPLFVVSDLSELWVRAEVDEADVGRVAVGRPVELRVAAWPDERFAGTVAFVGDTVSPATRRVTVRCTVANPDGRLKPEMFARVLLGEGPAREVLAVPASALQDVDGRPVVFVDRGDGRFALREVVTGPEVDGEVEIRDGLAPGDVVVTGGAFLLKSELLRGDAAEGDA